MPQNVVVLESKTIEQEFKQLLKVLEPYTDNIKKTEDPLKAQVVLRLDAKTANEIGTEGYYLEITDQQIQIKAANAAGLFYGIQTLKQLLFLADTKSGRPVLASQIITDQPCFQWTSPDDSCVRPILNST